jgi:hypothetical protein
MRQNLPSGSQGVLSNTSPWAVEFGFLPYVFWNGAGNDGIFYSSAVAYPLSTSVGTIISALQAGESFFVRIDNPEVATFLAQQATASLGPNATVGTFSPASLSVFAKALSTEGGPFLQALPARPASLTGNTRMLGGSLPGIESPVNLTVLLASVAIVVMFALECGFEVELSWGFGFFKCTRPREDQNGPGGNGGNAPPRGGGAPARNGG